jgi:hypothetical protein
VLYSVSDFKERARFDGAADPDEPDARPRSGADGHAQDVNPRRDFKGNGEMSKQKNAPDERRRTSRRRFAKAVAAAVVAAPIGAASGQRPTATPPPAEPKAPPNPSTTPAQQASQQRPSPVAEGYEDVVRARFGGKFTDEEFERIKRDLRGNVSAAEALRAYKLENWDEPDTIFNA